MGVVCKLIGVGSKTVYEIDLCLFVLAEDEPGGEGEASCSSWRGQREDHQIRSRKTKKSGKKKEEEKLNVV